jgi:hypothetical protein
VRGDCGVGLIEVAINVWIAREAVRFGAVGEVVDVFRTEDVDEFECGFAVRLRLHLTLSLGCSGRSNRR